MHHLSLLPTLVLSYLSKASCSPLPEQRGPDLDTKGFQLPTVSHSLGGSAICVSGLVAVNVSTDVNTKLDLPINVSQLQAVDLVLGLQAANSSLAASVSEKSSSDVVDGTFNISAQMCYPVAHPRQNQTTVQFLTHGIAFSKTYWDFALPNNSYIDTAAKAGRATFSYDRLGIGNSSHPDPIEVVQGGIQVVIAEQLVRLLRQGRLGNHAFSHVIGVGHSYGSLITTSVAASSPSSFDAVVATGFSTNRTGGSQFTAALNLEPASLSAPPRGRFQNLPSSYLIPSTKYGIQYSFFRGPNFEPSVLTKAFDEVETTTLGESFTRSSFATNAANFTGPVLIANGARDLDFCDGDCLYPKDISAATLEGFFPNANNQSASYNLPEAGHGVNLAKNAPLAFDKIQEWISSLGF
ncbi:hypothetical protein PV08_00330 [Exophiala spinifera]|uniref:AB hydrolase-1 domain-containing protein n=1 Tax=Exophiala spinifera TaxID=91928 RepID=A0A0D1YWR8_9EURO|nr:uncharacterized protein PV08_00330 [Exophiala spinifera]KIW19756.1 hypothetical protein PV08_00330 [Exophiala spinifera]